MVNYVRIFIYELKPLLKHAEIAASMCLEALLANLKPFNKIANPNNHPVNGVLINLPEGKASNSDFTGSTDVTKTHNTIPTNIIYYKSVHALS